MIYEKETVMIELHVLLHLQVLHEAQTVLRSKYDGDFMNMLKKAEGSAQKLVKIVTSEIASFNDTAQFEGKPKTTY